MPEYGRSADLLVELGRLGQKTRAGFYDYSPGDRFPRPSPLVAKLIEKVRRIMASNVAGLVMRKSPSGVFWH